MVNVSRNLETKCYRDHTKDFLSSASFLFLVEQIKIEKWRDGFFSNRAGPTEGQSASFWWTAYVYVYRAYIRCVSFAWALAPAVHSACIVNFIDSRSRSGFLRNPVTSKNCGVTPDPYSAPLSIEGTEKKMITAARSRGWQRSVTSILIIAVTTGSSGPQNLRRYFARRNLLLRDFRGARETWELTDLKLIIQCLSARFERIFDAAARNGCSPNITFSQHISVGNYSVWENRERFFLQRDNLCIVFFQF